jgi:formate hydrogenlyase transcriptional activator
MRGGWKSPSIRSWLKPWQLWRNTTGGNVRELENFIERGTELQIPLAELKQRTKVALFVHSREHIVRALSETSWVIGGATGAAARLGMKRTTLQSRMIKLGITRPN